MTNAKIASNQSENKHPATPAESPILTELRRRKAPAQDYARRLHRAAYLGLPLCDRCQVRPLEQEICCFQARERFTACSECVEHQAAEYQRLGYDFEKRDVDDGFVTCQWSELTPPQRQQAVSLLGHSSIDPTQYSYEVCQDAVCSVRRRLNSYERSMLVGDNLPKEIASNH